MHGATEGGNYRSCQDKPLESSEAEPGLTNCDAAKGRSFALHRIPIGASVTLHDSSRVNSKGERKRNTEIKKDKTTTTKVGLINMKLRVWIFSVLLKSDLLRRDSVCMPVA
jgi:hypothetical protein